MAGRTIADPWQDFDLVMEASRYAAEVHRNDVRKATTVPYLSHLWSVAALVLEQGGDDGQVAAALLHDVVEDHGGTVRLGEVRRMFGDDVADLVADLSDSMVDTTAGDAKPPWRKRKEAYLRHLAAADVRVTLVSACDKLHNGRCILADLRVLGARVWDRFTTADPADQLWYYEALARTLRDRVPDARADELDRTVAGIRAEVEAGSS
jgi:(p)ppGpp synthase/HD superfamily hydrolase